MASAEPTSVDRAAAARAALATADARPGGPKPDPILVVDGLAKRFGGLMAVEVDHFEVQRHSITALIGPNGAGKTTFFNLLTGFTRRDRGQWQFDGQSTQRQIAATIARAGMVRTFQLTKALARMSLIDNMRLAAPRQSGESFLAALVPPRWRSQEQEITRRAEELLERFRLDHLRDEYAATLSGGQRKLLEMARALMVEPSMLMLDEPMAGVNPALVDSLLDHILDLRADGVTILFVEHDMDVVQGISDWVACMAEGSLIAEGPPDVVGRDERVIDAYLGTSERERA